ncbi:hypothetical protein HPB48_012424 [Haemaphysalis longicornis]|uniref:Carboxylesterase type B domain-containing protein n=1 Tax=Haemaphysalis longicornis TaxID=44386 RepID=A0A9J6G177_HAELO|nr:hypothetical protein HPB48_012424 [Haemaphysalis longicornis]
MLLYSIACVLLALSVARSTAPPTARLESGDVKGLQLNVYGKRVNAFLGIRYATPPVGDLRFRKPSPKASWSTPRWAKRFGKRCMQELALDAAPEHYADVPGMNEDCLFPERVPVMVWIHGGHFNSGSADNPAFDGSVLAAEENVVVVSFNYRLGFLGFLNAVHSNASGNAGLYDQLLALTWVQSNIAAFNGNASLGGTVHATKAVESTGKSVLKADALAVEVGCSKSGHSIISHPNDVIDCLKSRPAHELLLAQLELRHHGIDAALPTYGTEFLPHNPDLIHDLRGFKDVEVLMGHNREEARKLISSVFEGRFEALKQANNMTKEDAEVALHILLSAQGYRRPVASEVVKHCLRHAAVSDARTLAELVESCTAGVAVACPAFAFARKLANAGLSVHYYSFDYVAEEVENHFHTSPDHAAETPLVFGLPLRFPGKFEEADRSISQIVMNAWAKFAERGTPPALLGTLWPRFSEARPMYLEIDEASTRLTEADTVLCGLLKK